MTNQRHPIEADGVNVIDCGTLELDYYKDGAVMFDVSWIDTTARYRVLLERIDG